MATMFYKPNNSKSCQNFITEGVGNKRTKKGYSYKVSKSNAETIKIKQQGFVSLDEFMNPPVATTQQASPQAEANDNTNG